jgi:hypothetical protein
MFIQVIEGKTSDPDALHRQIETWHRDLAPGAIGFLGSTGGATSSGDCILIARFESEEAARRNSDRPEQTAWWKETERCFDGPVRFHDTADVQMMRKGGSDRAGFVQVMEGHVTDPGRAHELADEAEPLLADVRPDLIGSITAFFDDGEFAEVAYFTSEADARQGEASEMPEELASRFAERQDVMKVERYLDVDDPWLVGS